MLFFAGNMIDLRMRMVCFIKSVDTRPIFFFFVTVSGNVAQHTASERELLSVAAAIAAAAAVERDVSSKKVLVASGFFE